MTSGTHNRRIHYFSQHWQAPVPLVQLLWPGTLIAKDTVFIPRVLLSVAQYQFSKSPKANALPNNGAFPEVEFDVTFKSLGIGGTLFKNSDYLDMLYIGSLNENVSFSIEDPALPGGSFSNDFDVTRRDYALTVGKKRLNGRAGLYTGYKVGKTGDSQPLGQHLTFEEKGFFVSGNYGWLIADAGVLSLNLAYAKLDGWRSQKTITEFEDLGFRIDSEGTGVAEGLSYGASWSFRLTDHVSYCIGLNIEEYTFKNITDPNANFTDEIEEKFSNIAFST